MTCSLFNRMGRRAALFALLLAACGPGGGGAGAASPSPAPTMASAPPASPSTSSSDASWTAFQHDSARTGQGPATPILDSVSQSWSAPVDGQLYASPLVIHNQVIAATENDTVYALDAAAGKVLWQRHLGEPMPASRLPCGNIDPSGITSTPVLDPVGGSLYVVGFLQPGRHELYALDLGTGAVRFHRTVDPPGANPLTHQQRGALTYSRGIVYIPFGGLYGDCGNYKGAIVAAHGDGSGDLFNFQVPTAREGGVWATPGAVLTAGGELLVATGNAASTGGFDHGNSVLRLSPELKLTDFWAPANWAALSRDDLDVGSMTPLPVSDGLVLQAGKAGFGYLVRGDHLGNVGGEVFSGPACQAYGGGLFKAPLAYLPCSDGLLALRINGGSFALAWRGPNRSQANSPILAYGSLWTIDGAQLLALEPQSGRLRFQKPLGRVAHFATPAAGDDHVFVPAADRLLAFGAG